MSLDKIPQDKVVTINDILSFEDVTTVLDSAKTWSSTMTGVVIIGMNKEGQTITWHTGLTRHDLVYVAEMLKIKVFYQDDEDDD